MIFLSNLYLYNDLAG